jgi:hypothetical protein
MLHVCKNNVSEEFRYSNNSWDINLVSHILALWVLLVTTSKIFNAGFLDN